MGASNRLELGRCRSWRECLNFLPNGPIPGNVWGVLGHEVKTAFGKPRPPGRFHQSVPLPGSRAVLEQQLSIDQLENSRCTALRAVAANPDQRIFDRCRGEEETNDVQGYRIGRKGPAGKVIGDPQPAAVPICELAGGAVELHGSWSTTPVPQRGCLLESMDKRRYQLQLLVQFLQAGRHLHRGNGSRAIALQQFGDLGSSFL